jgi:hypothetical protein
MDVRTVNNLPPAATHDEAVRCLLAIELSKKSWIVAANTPLSEKISRYRLKGCDWKGLLELIEKIRARVAREAAGLAEDHRSSWSRALACFKSNVSKPSVNQP